MRHKSLGTGVLLLGLLLGTSSSAYADAISTTSLTLSNFQVVPSSGTIMFFLPRNQALVRATNSLNEDALEIVVTESLTTAQASANVTFASASAVANSVNSTGSQTATHRFPAAIAKLSLSGKQFYNRALLSPEAVATLTFNSRVCW